MAAYSFLKGISAEAAVEQFARSRQKIDNLRLGKLSDLTRNFWFQDPVDLYSVVVVAIQNEDVSFGLEEAVSRIDEAERLLFSPNRLVRPNYFVSMEEISARFGLSISDTAAQFRRVLPAIVYPSGNEIGRIRENRSAEDAAFDVFNGRRAGQSYSYLGGGGQNNRPI